MHLIDTCTYRLIKVNRPEDVKYAILSHTWGNEEVLFDDMEVGNTDGGKKEIAKKKGWRKVELTCELARKHGIRYAWIDSCCINKKDNSELNEAINAMFGWYQKALVCFTYLCDLVGEEPESLRVTGLEGCRWFSRGWTLQELIASKAMEFYDRDWTMLGTKDSLRDEISKITDIDVAVLLDSEKLSTVPVARKMSWAAKRETTREEDIAYSLLGIFDVELPLIYGQGAKAFIQLQEAIAQKTNDLSLFAWTTGDTPAQSYYGVLARHPRQFSACKKLENIYHPLRYDSQSFNLTNRGIRFQTTLKMDYRKGDYLMHLHCRYATDKRAGCQLGVVAIRLIKTASGFARHKAEKPLTDDDEATNSAVEAGSWDPFIRSVDIPKVISPVESRLLEKRFHNAFRFKIDVPDGVECEMMTHNPRRKGVDRDPESLRPSYWDPAGSAFLTEGYEYFTGMLNIELRVTEPFEGVALFKFLCGFLPDMSTTSSIDTTDCQGSCVRLRPWVALLPQPDTYSEHIWHKKRMGEALNAHELRLAILPTQYMEIHYPQFLTQAGQTIRRFLGEGKALPTDSTGWVFVPWKTPCVPKVAVSLTSRPGAEVHDVRISLKVEKTISLGPLSDGIWRTGKKLWHLGCRERRTPGSKLGVPPERSAH